MGETLGESMTTLTHVVDKLVKAVEQNDPDGAR